MSQNQTPDLENPKSTKVDDVLYSPPTGGSTDNSSNTSTSSGFQAQNSVIAGLKLLRMVKKTAQEDVIEYGKVVESASKHPAKVVSMILTLMTVIVPWIVLTNLDSDLVVLGFALLVAIVFQTLYYVFVQRFKEIKSRKSYYPLLGIVVAIFILIICSLIHFSVHVPLKKQANDWVTSGASCEWKYDQMTFPTHDNACIVSQDCLEGDSCGCTPQEPVKSHKSYYYASVYEVTYGGKTYTGVGCKSDLGPGDFFMQRQGSAKVFEYSNRNGFVNPPAWHCSSPIVGSSQCLIRFDGSVQATSGNEFNTPTSHQPYVEVIANSSEAYWNEAGETWNVYFFYQLALIMLFCCISYYIDGLTVCKVQRHFTHWEYIQENWYEFTPRPKEGMMGYVFVLEHGKNAWIHKIAPSIRREINTYMA